MTRVKVECDVMVMRRFFSIFMLPILTQKHKRVVVEQYEMYAGSCKGR